jgi:GntR family transcriptional regulator
MPRAIRTDQASPGPDVFAGLAIDAASAVPIYYQVEEQLRDRIESGELPEGTRLPAERDIAAHLGISRMTLRQALTRLANDGLIAARRGGGTVVTRRRLVGSLSLLDSFSGEARAQGRAPTSRLVDVERIDPDPELRRALQVGARGSVIRVRRVRVLDGEPVGLQTAYLPAHLCAGVLEADLERLPLYQVLREECGLTPAEGKEVLSATVLDPWEAELIGGTTGQPAFLLKRTTKDVEGRPFEVVKSVLRGDRFSFEASLRPDQVGG